MQSEVQSIVVTGGSGFVGRHFVSAASEMWPDARLIVWDQREAGFNTKVEFVKVDITDPATYLDSLRGVQPTWIVHLAAVSAVGVSQKEPGLTRRVNVEATEQLLKEITSSCPDTSMLAISSSEIYGRESTTPLVELSLSEAMPRNPYAASKLEMEQIIEDKYLDRVLRVRPFPHIGPGQGRGFVTADFASQIVAIERGEQDPTMRVGNLSAQRDFTDVRDVVRAYCLLIKDGENGEVYHVASGKVVAVQQVLDILLKMSEVEIVVRQDPDQLRSSDVTVMVGDATKLREVTGWEQQYELTQSLTDILNFWRKN